ncbi:MAG: hypothetical protein AAGE05_03520 [Pseudomonadota bacterium]
MTLKPLALAAGLAALTMPAMAQDEMARETPRGTYLVYADETGTAFVSYEPTLVETGVWPLSFFYYQGDAVAGRARIAARADCAQGVVRGRLTDAMAADGQPMDLPPQADRPQFAFDRAGGGGDEAIVGFICGTGQARLVQAETPIHNSLEATARTYVQLRTLGLEDQLARSLAIRDRATADPLIETAVPEALRDRVRAAIDPRR